jgi:ribulose-phosphate 3-epimerase
MGATIQTLSGLPANRLLAEFSLWSADLVRIADDVARVDSFVDIYHADVADGHFSPALLLFPDLIAQLRPLTAKPIHVHLMVADSGLMDQINQFAEAGADIISIHAENRNVEAGLAAIRAHGLAAGIVLQLHTPVAAATPRLDDLAMLTLLGTKMGIKGVGLDPEAEARMREARDDRQQAGRTSDSACRGWRHQRAHCPRVAARRRRHHRHGITCFRCRGSGAADCLGPWADRVHEWAGVT